MLPPMAELPIPPGLPHNFIIRTLLSKEAELGGAMNRRPPYSDWLKLLRDRVSSEVSQIVRDFPLFTPHDEPNHIHPLFDICTRLVGEEVLSQLGACELFILSSALYGHDWGMAVSDEEKAAIQGTAGNVPADGFLQGESHAFREKLRKRGLDATDEVPQELWQDYIRDTHALRSGQRLRAFFMDKDPVLGEAVAKVAESHAWDVEEVRRLPVSSALQGELVNVQVLALYLRLSDLMDLGGDRTPYALWKFVNPSYGKSQEEWEKHRALGPAAVQSLDDQARSILVSGVTLDHAVFAVLEDLRVYAQDQLKLSTGLFRLMPSRYNPNLVHLEWSVETRGFEPLSFRFEFDRAAMVRLLSQEIYGNDKYVFLRELLQNSIDAVRLRMKLHEQRDSDVRVTPRIDVTVRFNQSGKQEILFEDNGTGMSRFIIMNYLVVAGKSYYRSDDFAAFGVPLDPISRFGVGILSCFANSDELVISTKQDPMLFSEVEGIELTVVDPGRHIKVRKLTEADARVGTSVRIVLSDPLPPGSIIAYMQQVYGFPEIPVTVHEQESGSLMRIDNSTISESSLADAFPWDELYLPQDVDLARQVMEVQVVKVLDSRRSVHGFIVLLKLKTEFEAKYTYYLDDPATEVVRDSAEVGIFRRFENSNELKAGVSASSAHRSNLRLFRDGILVPEASYGAIFENRRKLGHYVYINVSTDAMRLTLSRSQAFQDTSKWVDCVVSEVTQYLASQAHAIDDSDLRMRFYELCRLDAYTSPLSASLSDLLHDVDFGVLRIRADGFMEFVPEVDLEAEIYLVPKGFTRGEEKRLLQNWSKPEWATDQIPDWELGQCYVEGLTYASVSFGSVRSAEEIWARRLRKDRALKSVMFTSMMDPIGRRAARECWSTLQEDCSAVDYRLVKMGQTYFSLPFFVTFEEPFEAYLTSDATYINKDVPVGSAFEQCCIAFMNRYGEVAIDGALRGRIWDALAAATERKYSSFVGVKWLHQVVHFIELMQEVGLYPVSEPFSFDTDKIVVPPVADFGFDTSVDEESAD